MRIYIVIGNEVDTNCTWLVKAFMKSDEAETFAAACNDEVQHYATLVSEWKEHVELSGYYASPAPWETFKHRYDEDGFPHYDSVEYCVHEVELSA